MSTLGPKSGVEPPAAIAGPAAYASSPRISANLAGAPLQLGSQCIDVATSLVSLVDILRRKAVNQVLKIYNSAPQGSRILPPMLVGPQYRHKSAGCTTLKRAMPAGIGWYREYRHL